MISTGVRLLFLLSVFASVASAGVSGDTARRCPESAAFYERAGYKVGAIRIDAPLLWLSGVEQRLADLLAGLPLKTGASFKESEYQQSFLEVSRQFPELKATRAFRFAARIERPQLVSCNDQMQTLDVVYHIYTIGLSPYLTRIFERRDDEVQRTVVETKETRLLQTFFLQPFLGYDQSRRTFSGASLSISRHQKTQGPLFDQIDFSGFGSDTSTRVSLVAKGSRDSDVSPIAHREWMTGYRYSRDPGQSFAIKQSRFSAQFTAATRPLGELELILRFGAALDGGNQQTDIPVTEPATVASNRYMGLKTFFGISLRSGRQTLKASYGLQLGESGEAFRLDFAKHILDVAYQTRVLLADHRPLSIDLRFNAGLINQFNVVPAAERFFGGNLEQQFLDGNSWLMRSGPFIRSFPQYGLTRVLNASQPGGDRFFSANATFAPTVWSIPLIPAVVLEEPELMQAFDLALGGAESSLQNELISESPAFLQLAGRTSVLPSRLEELKQTLAGIQGQNPGTEVREALIEAQIQLDVVTETVATIRRDLETGRPRTSDLRKLVVGFPSNALSIASYLEDLAGALNGLRILLMEPAGSELERNIAFIASFQRSAAAEFRAFELSAAWADTAQRARREMRYARRVIADLMHEANLVAISPAFFLDAARISQGGKARGDVRFALGGGLRLTVVSLDVTLGYAWNVDRREGEHRGAFVFSMELSNLFR